MIGIRGAIRIERNRRDAIYRDTQRLLREILDRNGISEESVVSAFFTMTPDLSADFPACAARQMGWTEVPMLGAQETPVPGALDRTIRVLLHVDAPGPARHVYLGEAAAMRPDLAREGDATPDLEAGPASSPKFGPLLVVGLGLIGGSVALAVRRAGLFTEVWGHDLSSETLEQARRAGAITGGSRHVDDLLGRAETVVLAIPVGRIPNWLDEHSPELERGTVVVDVGSTKGEIVEVMNGLPAGVEAVGAHPMAGTEESGIGSARPDLFYGARWALVETERTGEKARRVVRSIVEAVGGVPFWIAPDRHDAAVARTSHLPYVVSAALVRHVAGEPGSASREEMRALTGPGLRDMTRLAGSDPALMAEILLSNWPRLQAEIRGFIESLTMLSERLEELVEADRESDVSPSTLVARELEQVRAARESLEA